MKIFGLFVLIFFISALIVSGIFFVFLGGITDANEGMAYFSTFILTIITYIIVNKTIIKK